ncbi:MAG: hypothetical protein Q4F45_03175 [Alistipes sp.]|nr:hypothetical protein [Alistipes sp.]
MKKVLFLLLLICGFVQCIRAQQIPGTFLGIDINDEIPSITEKLKNKGFSVENTDEGVDGSISFLVGKYDGKNCTATLTSSSYATMLYVAFKVDGDNMSFVRKVCDDFYTPFASDGKYITSQTMSTSQDMDADSFPLVLVEGTQDVMNNVVLIGYSDGELSLMITAYREGYKISDSQSNIDTAPKEYTFKGIPIEGSIRGFAEKLISQGYQLHEFSSLQDDSISLTGKFFGKDVILYIYSDNREVRTVAISFLNEYYLSKYRPSLYREIRDSLSKKYTISDGWMIIREDESIADLTDEQMEENVRYNDITYSYRVFDRVEEHTYPYIALLYDESGLRLYYTNPANAAKAQNKAYDDL